MTKIAHIICSLGGVGFIRPLSATWGSLAIGIVLYFLFPLISIPAKIAITIVTFLAGWHLTNIIEKEGKLHDPHFVVIDEAVGMMITCFFLTQVWWHFALAFILFRIFDILKLWPASIFDKKKGGFAVMFDDVIMAIPSLIAVQILITFL